MHNIIEELASDAVFDTTHKPDNCQSFWEMLIKYYSHTEYIRTPRQIRRDETILFGRVRCKAWMIIPLAVLSQFCLGSLYAWSIFNKPIDKYVFDDPEANRAQITFYIALGMLGASGAALGPWVESHPPKVCAALAAAVFFAGHCTAALGLFCKEIGMLYFGYGFVGGIGLGLGYVTTIDAVIQWYPNARGLASGLAVSGFGSGATAFSNLNAALIRRFSVPQVFVILGAINFVVMILCAVVMRPPPPNYNLPGVAVDMMSHSIAEIHCPPQCSVQQTIKGKSAAIGGQTVTVGSNSGDPVLIIPLAQALSSADFWLLWVAFFVNLVFGVVIISNLASMTTNMFGNHIPAAVTTIVTIEGAFNASGRLFFGWVSDWVGRRRTFLFIITLQIAIVACLIVIIPRKTFWPFVVLVWLATLCYGGGVGVIPATLADMFGASNMSGCHGVILTGWSVAAIGGGLTYTGVVALLTKYKGHTLGDPSVYVTNLYWILSLLVCGWFVLLFVRVTPRERMYPKVHGQVFHHSLAGIMFRFARGVHQHGLHDYEFLAPAPVSGESSKIDQEYNRSVDDSTSNACNGDKMEDVSLGPDARDTKSLHHHVKPLAPAITSDAISTSTFMHDENPLSLSAKKPLASEAYDYVANNRASVHSAIQTRGSCVQLVCVTPPYRRCLMIFNKWRLEVVSSEEVSTVWRMYLSCALLASADMEK